ncbi:MAG: hypothetical protein EXS42_04530 [Lacunisphaera sp.]|nr:hypothetical protein [Lacunisphaera sp.]
MLACLESHADIKTGRWAGLFSTRAQSSSQLRTDEKHTFSGLLVTGINTQNSLLRGPDDSELIRL